MKKQFYSSLLIVATLIGSLDAQTTFTISTFGGTGVASSTGDGGNVSLATFNAPHGVTTDAAGNVFISEFGGNKIRKVNSSGIVSLYAGTGVAGFGGDGGPATAAQFNAPTGIALDASGNLYIAEYLGNRVRVITPTGTITTIAGTGVPGSAGDGGLCTAAQLNAPTDVKIDPAGNVYIVEGSGNRVRKINTSGIISTIVGNGTATSTGDGGLASAATTNFPVSLYFDAAGNMYICELIGNKVRKVNTSGIISTIIGTGVASSTGDGGLATAATLNQAGCMLIDAGGNILVSEYTGARIRSVNAAGIISTAVGTGVGGFSGDGGLATAAQINGPFQLAQAIAPNQIYVAEYLNNRIRLLTSSSCTTAVTATVASSSVTCNGSANGSATVNAVGGGPFTYTWIPGAQTTSVVTGLAAGSYTVITKNSCGNTAVNTVNITQPSPMITTIFGNPLTVCAGGTSTLTTIASGGTPSYTYSWSPSGGATNTAVVTTTATTIYTATAIDANSCTKTSTIAVTVSTCVGVPNLSLNTESTIYPNPNKGEFVIINGSLGANMHYEIYNGLGQLVTKDEMNPVETKVILNEKPGIYLVKILDGTQVMRVQKIVKE